MPRHKINNLFRENVGVKLSENRSSGNKGYPANVRYGAPQHEVFSLPHSSHHGANVQVEKPGLAEYYTQNVNSNQSSALVSNERSKMTSGDELKDAAQSIFDRSVKREEYIDRCMRERKDTEEVIHINISTYDFGVDMHVLDLNHHNLGLDHHSTVTRTINSLSLCAFHCHI